HSSRQSPRTRNVRTPLRISRRQSSRRTGHRDSSTTLRPSPAWASFLANGAPIYTKGTLLPRRPLTTATSSLRLVPVPAKRSVSSSLLPPHSSKKRLHELHQIRQMPDVLNNGTTPCRTSADNKHHESANARTKPGPQRCGPSSCTRSMPS